MSTYAQGTSVAVWKSRQEIEQLLDKHRAARRATAQEEGRAVVMFELQDRRVQFELKLPARADFAKKKRNGRLVSVTPLEQDRAWEQACRERWRALLLALKSKFVSLETGIETFEEAFLAHIVIPGTNGQRIGMWFAPQLAESYAKNKPPPMLPSGDGR